MRHLDVEFLEGFFQWKNAYVHKMLHKNTLGVKTVQGQRCKWVAMCDQKL